MLYSCYRGNKSFIIHSYIYIKTVATLQMSSSYKSTLISQGSLLLGIDNASKGVSDGLLVVGLH